MAGNYTAGYSGDGGPAIAAQLRYPREIVLDKAGNLYISDSFNHAIRRVDSATGIITTVAGNGTAGYSGEGGPGTNAQLQFPRGLALDVLGNLYIADTANHRVRKLDVKNQIISTVAGNGTGGYSGDGGLAVDAQLNAPEAVVLDSAGNLYIGVFQGGEARQVEASSQKIRTMYRLCPASRASV
jgi:sugar lactone lactonase YvrE